MKPRRKRLPSICYHKPSGRDYVRLAGKMTYLGPHGDPGNQAVYDRLMAEFLGGGRTIPTSPDDQPEGYLIADMIADYLCHAESYYRNPDGSPTQEVENIKVTICSTARPLPAPGTSRLPTRS